MAGFEGWRASAGQQAQQRESVSFFQRFQGVFNDLRMAHAAHMSADDAKKARPRSLGRQPLRPVADKALHQRGHGLPKTGSAAYEQNGQVQQGSQLRRAADAAMPAVVQAHCSLNHKKGGSRHIGVFMLGHAGKDAAQASGQAVF